MALLVIGADDDVAIGINQLARTCQAGIVDIGLGLAQHLVGRDDDVLGLAIGPGQSACRGHRRIGDRGIHQLAGLGVYGDTVAFADRCIHDPRRGRGRSIIGQQPVEAWVCCDGSNRIKENVRRLVAQRIEGQRHHIDRVPGLAIAVERGVHHRGLKRLHIHRAIGRCNSAIHDLRQRRVADHIGRDHTGPRDAVATAPSRPAGRNHL